jgi:hypothetical protein
MVPTFLVRVLVCWAFVPAGTHATAIPPNWENEGKNSERIDFAAAAGRRVPWPQAGIMEAWAEIACRPARFAGRPAGFAGPDAQIARILAVFFRSFLSVNGKESIRLR